jgi:hypothetical protein
MMENYSLVPISSRNNKPFLVSEIRKINAGFTERFSGDWLASIRSFQMSRPIVSGYSDRRVGCQVCFVGFVFCLKRRVAGEGGP